jgi:hypothetical protein
LALVGVVIDWENKPVTAIKDRKFCEMPVREEELEKQCS